MHSALMLARQTTSRIFHQGSQPAAGDILDESLVDSSDRVKNCDARRAGGPASSRKNNLLALPTLTASPPFSRLRRTEVWSRMQPYCSGKVRHPRLLVYGIPLRQIHSCQIDCKTSPTRACCPLSSRLEAVRPWPCKRILNTSEEIWCGRIQESQWLQLHACSIPSDCSLFDLQMRVRPQPSARPASSLILGFTEPRTMRPQDQEGVQDRGAFEKRCITRPLWLDMACGSSLFPRSSVIHWL